MWAAIIYAFVWLCVITAAGAVYFTGNFNSTILIAFGFICSTLIFTGLIGVLPVLMNEHHASKL